MKYTINFISKCDLRAREVVLKIGNALESSGEMVKSGSVAPVPLVLCPSLKIGLIVLH